MTTATAMRYTAIPLGFFSTAGLLLLMATLIQTDYHYIEPAAPTTIAKIVMPELVIADPVPKAIDRPEDPPVPPPVPQVDDKVKIETEGPNTKVFATPTAAADDFTINLAQPGDYLPLVKVAPHYPRRALTRGMEGEVVVSFTVTRTGATRDVIVISAETLEGEATRVFNSAAIRAAEGFKYKPKVENGVPVEVHGVQNRFIFELSK
ncbi:energy transducer TonB [Gilvimarinus xylanilyticus]|uniref:Protein TonB n=1 Tax=Gilvimarinus xylanilyticus TaxID=2944139 RepID=A0A9X2I8S9_9GAMM|nr:energy transducer TonB [Gilvimarinus xylanilyticus]MCP8900857.1 energy transducer TonB [Gilvimarinus xylanilyticus]